MFQSKFRNEEEPILEKGKPYFVEIDQVLPPIPILGEFDLDDISKTPYKNQTINPLKHGFDGILESTIALYFI